MMGWKGFRMQKEPRTPRVWLYLKWSMLLAAVKSAGSQKDLRSLRTLVVTGEEHSVQQVKSRGVYGCFRCRSSQCEFEV